MYNQGFIYVLSISATSSTTSHRKPHQSQSHPFMTRDRSLPGSTQHFLRKTTSTLRRDPAHVPRMSSMCVRACRSLATAMKGRFSCSWNLWPNQEQPTGSQLENPERLYVPVSHSAQRFGGNEPVIERHVPKGSHAIGSRASESKSLARTWACTALFCLRPTRKPRSTCKTKRMQPFSTLGANVLTG